MISLLGFIPVGYCRLIKAVIRARTLIATAPMRTKALQPCVTEGSGDVNTQNPFLSAGFPFTDRFPKDNSFAMSKMDASIEGKGEMIPQGMKSLFLLYSINLDR